MFSGHCHTPAAKVSEPGGTPACGVLVDGTDNLVGNRVSVDLGVLVGADVLVGARVGVDG